MTGIPETRFCPFCREAIHVDAIKCKHCGTMLTGGTPAPPPATPVPGVFQLDAGSVIREYRIVRKLGEGGMGSVFMAEHAQTGQQVAMKVVAAELMLDPNIKRRFLEEARVMAALSHPNIVPLLTFFEEGGRLFLVMKFINGPSVEDLLEQGPLDTGRALSISRDVLAALDFAHSRSQPVIHRDIKPANILVDEEGRAMVTDFGVAKALGREKMTRTAGVVGTYEYMSPEQVQGGEIGPATDQYSFGITLFRMLTGIVPFPQRSDTGIDCMNAHLQGTVPPLLEFREGLPAGLDVVVQRALAKDPAQRFSTGAELVQALEGTIGGRGAASAMPPVATPSQSPVATPVPASSVETVLEDDPVGASSPLSPWLWMAVVAGVVMLALAAVFIIPNLREDGGGDGSALRAEKVPTGKALPAKTERSPPAKLEMAAEEKMPVSGPPETVAGSVCALQCDGRQCGEDGCGGICGTCPEGHSCSGGQCSCVPQCAGRSCGEDGCAGVCGTCGANQKCERGACVADLDLAARRRSAERSFEGWIAAWNDRDADTFGTYFHREYGHTNTWGNRTTREGRGDRIRSSRSLWGRVNWMQIHAENVRIQIADHGGAATIRFRQEYRSGPYKSDGDVTLKLRWEGDRWWIVHEEFVGVKKWK